MRIAGIGGIAKWRGAVEDPSLGATKVQTCTGEVQYGYPIAPKLHHVLTNLARSKGFELVNEIVVLALPSSRMYNHLDLGHIVKPG